MTRTPVSRRVAVAAPAALAAAVLAAGCGGDGEPDPVASTTLAATAPAPGSTTTSRAARTTTSGAGSTTTSGAAETATSPGMSPPASPPPAPASKPEPTTTTKTRTVKIPPARAKLGSVQRFSGTGDRELGTIKLARTAVVRWTVSGSSFELRDGSGKLKIAGTGETGQSFAAAGSYRSVTIQASGRWTLSFTSLGS